MPGIVCWKPVIYFPLVFCNVSLAKKCQNSRIILNSSSSGMRLNWTKYVSPYLTAPRRNSIFSLGSIMFVVSSMRSKLFVKTADIASASCFEKFSKPACYLVPAILSNSLRRDRCLVVSPIYCINRQ